MPAYTQVWAWAPSGKKIRAVMINIAGSTYCRKQLLRISIRPNNTGVAN